MLKQFIRSVTFYLSATVTMMYCIDEIRRRIQKVAEIEKVDSEIKYVAVRLARGDYNNANGFVTMKTDYQFYKTISKFHE